MPARVITLLSLASAVPSLAAGITKPGVRTPPTMKEVRAAGICGDDFKCVHIDTVSTPVPHSGEALIRVNSSSVNPVDVDTVELQGCTRGCGSDISGIVVDCPGCKTIKAGDEVWTVGQPAYAEYTVVTEGIVSLKPQSLPFQEAATIPIVGLTSFMSLKRTGSLPGTPLPAGSPWASGNYSNLTVAITAGSGGTGFIGIQMAKAWGAKHVFTATTGEGIDFVKSLGADFVVDYTKGELFDSDQLPDNSVDIVYDNYGAEGTADKAMRVLRPGGVYLLMPHGECFESKSQAPPCLSANPKEGVRQLNYATGPDFEAHGLEGLDAMAKMFDAGDLKAHIDKAFSLEDTAQAFAYSKGPGQGGVGSHIGKISITVA